MKNDLEVQLRRLAELDPSRADRLLAAADAVAEIDAELDALFNQWRPT